MTRHLIVCLILLGLSGCAAQPLVSAWCAVGESVPAAVGEAALHQDEIDCEPSVAGSRTVSMTGAVSQTRGQTRTVGVPREFLVAMFVLILLVALA